MEAPRPDLALKLRLALLREQLRADRELAAEHQSGLISLEEYLRCSAASRKMYESALEAMSED